MAAAVDLAVETWGRLDCMFNNAGVIGAVGPLVDTTAEAWHQTLAVLLNSAFFGTKHAARVMIPRRSGVYPVDQQRRRSGRRPRPPRLHRGQDRHPRPHPIGGHRALSPRDPGERDRSRHDPDRDDGHRAHRRPHLDRGRQRALPSTNPLGIASAPIDIANATLYLASDEARFVSGHTLVVDAGRSIDGGSNRFARSTPPCSRKQGRSS